MSAVTGPQVSSVSLVLSLIGTITGNRALAVPASAHREISNFIFRPSKVSTVSLSFWSVKVVDT